MFMNEKKYLFIRNMYYKNINEIRNNKNLNENEKKEMIKKEYKKIENLNKRNEKIYNEILEKIKNY